MMTENVRDRSGAEAYAIVARSRLLPLSLEGRPRAARAVRVWSRHPAKSPRRRQGIGDVFAGWMKDEARFLLEANGDQSLEER